MTNICSKRHCLRSRTVNRAMIFLVMLTSLSARAELARAVDIIPMEAWFTFDQRLVGEEPIELLLRTQYESAALFPEPVILRQGTTLPEELAIETDSDVAAFSPYDNFAKLTIDFIGTNSGRTYRLLVSANRFGSRKPVELLLSSE